MGCEFYFRKGGLHRFDKFLLRLLLLTGTDPNTSSGTDPNTSSGTDPNTLSSMRNFWPPNITIEIY
jgi:hypothetical protein